MMTKIESKRRAKWKVLLVLPVAVILLLVFAEPRIAEQTFLGDGDASVDVLPSASLTDGAAQDKEQSAEEKKKMKQKQEKKLQHMKQEGKMLQEKELKLREMLKSEKNAEEKAKLKQTLVKILEKEKDLQIQLQNAGVKIVDGYRDEANGGDLKAMEKKIKERNLEIEKLQQKEAVIRKKIEGTKDKNTRTELKQILVKVIEKENHLKQEALTLTLKAKQKSKEKK